MKEYTMTRTLGWGHININVSNLEASIEFYKKLGFQPFVPSVPYLNLNAQTRAEIPSDARNALGLAAGAAGRACILQLDNGFPKIDLTELTAEPKHSPLANDDLGLVRICLISEDLISTYENLKSQSVEFLTPPSACHERLADVAVCKDPDGTLIELLQVYLERWGPYLS
jgi:catechol 2,3-dioxygenase-like lactoylglutathione lyase family enzyme